MVEACTIERGRDVEVLERRRVDEIMEQNVATAKQSDTLAATRAANLLPNEQGDDRALEALRRLCTSTPH
jgi:hypothetical protein